MPYSINTATHYIIDGHETNAGERAFLRDTHFVVIDGAEIGTAGLRQFLKDSRIWTISGGASKQAYESLLNTCSYAITGRSITGCAVSTSRAYIIDGVSPIGGPLPVRLTSLFTIEDVPQEATP